MSDELVVVTVDDPTGRVRVLRLDDADDAPTVVYVPGSGGGVSEAELDDALDPYATIAYVNSVAFEAGGGGPRSYHHEQPVAGVTWTVAHGLGFNPAGIVARDAVSIIEPADIDYPDTDTCVLTWSAATAGSVDLS